MSSPARNDKPLCEREIETKEKLAEAAATAASALWFAVLTAMIITLVVIL